jgi:hypothetical protein
MAGKTFPRLRRRGKLHAQMAAATPNSKYLLAGSLDLNGAEHARLASLLEDELDHLLLVAVRDFLISPQILFALCPGCLLPRGVGLAGGCNGIFNIVVSSDWDVPELLFGGWVDTAVLCL